VLGGQVQDYMTKCTISELGVICCYTMYYVWWFVLTTHLYYVINFWKPVIWKKKSLKNVYYSMGIHEVPKVSNGKKIINFCTKHLGGIRFYCVYKIMQ